MTKTNRQTLEAKVPQEMATYLVDAEEKGWTGGQVTSWVRNWLKDLVWNDKEPCGDVVMVTVPCSLVDRYGKLMDKEVEIRTQMETRRQAMELVSCDPRSEEYKENRRKHLNLVNALDMVREARRNMEDAMTWVLLAQL